MSILNVRIKLRKVKRFVKVTLVFLLIFLWFFTGSPGFWITSQFRFPPKIREAKAAVAFNVVSESHTGTTGSTSQASFTWNHGAAASGVTGILVFTFVNANADNALSVTYGGVSMTVVSGGRAVSTVASGENGDCKAWFLGTSVPQGTQAVVVNRTNNTNVMYAVAISVTGSADTEISGTPALLQGSSTQGLAEQNVDSGSIAALRFAGVNSGLSNVPGAGANSTANGASGSIDFGTRVIGTVRETADGSGNRPVGFSSGTSDDVAAVHLAIAEKTTTLGADAGNDPANTTVAPGSGIVAADSFTFESTSGTDTIAQLNVSLAGAGTPYDGLAQVEIRETNCAGTLYFNAISNFSGNDLTFSGGTSISSGTSASTYKICLTPKSHANMPDPPGGSYDLNPTVTDWTGGSTYAKVGSDTNAGTLTIDNLSPNGATATSGSAGDTKVTLNWTTSNSADFNTTNGSVVYRWAAASAGSEVPAEDSSPLTGDLNGTATTACVISSTSSTAQSKIDGTGGSAGCTTNTLINGQPYTYKVFQKDTNGNYDAGVLIGTFTPSAAAPYLTQNNFRFYVTANSVTLTDPWPPDSLDLGEKAALTQLPVQNTALVSGDKIRIKVNFGVTVTNLAATSQAFQLEYSAAEDCTTASSWTVVGAKASASIWRLYDEASIGDSTTEANNLSDSTVGAEGYYSEINPSGANPNAINTGQYSEWDWPVENNGATTNTTYCFRMAKSGGAAFDAYGASSYPKITTAPGTDALMRHGNFFQNQSEKGFFWVN